MNRQQWKQHILDEEHLKLLSIFHFIFGGFAVLFSSMFIFHFAFLTAFLSNPKLFQSTKHPQMDEAAMQIIQLLSVLFGLFIFLGICYGICLIISGIGMRKRKWRIFSFVIAIPNILLIPFGTILGILTIFVLDRKSVITLYQHQPEEFSFEDLKKPAAKGQEPTPVPGENPGPG